MRAILERAPAWLRDFIPSRFGEMWSAADHPPYFTRHRADAIVARVRIVSAMFAALTLFWIALDHLTLPWPLWGVMAALRTVSAAVFAALAVWPQHLPTRTRSLLLLAVMLGNPLVFHLFAEAMFAGVVLDDAGQVNARLYGMLPFVVIAGLSMFPLTVLEGLFFVAPVVAAASLGPVIMGRFDWTQQLPTVWVLLLITGVYLLSGMTQLQYMMALLRKASHDPLTGSFARRSGQEMVELYFQIARQRGAPLTIAFLDIDNFKSINDRYGHEAGDEMLRQTAERLNGYIRRGDVVVRWGGEEFLMLLPDTDADGARVVMRRVVSEWLGTRPDGTPLTASIGVAERMADHVTDWPELVDAADRRMYQAKHAGKARCMLPVGPPLIDAGYPVQAHAASTAAGRPERTAP